ncbi:protein SMAX1-LIKE 4 [Ricinus communis]|uniref:protein SMAX1-LIKE 4 n=1 Tax=Ricinus communis TaxID=3988 RepID=UPI00201B079F|nr:protein SMAX1-LIKE 4 [Ricinus communis]
MRSGACTVQQTLTAEAASVLKHSLSLARRRGHAQVTPLHVAATLLSSRASLLRRACLKSQPHQNSHPLQCRALELCFNVALNRLPTTPGPLLHGQPSLSNALIAALKRAQAHQRRGCIEQQQQQPLLTIKVELEQLIISILDDPSVSRVMREAGFSSTSVKSNIEDSSASSVFQCYTTSGGVFSSPSSPGETHREIINPTSFWQTHFLSYSAEKNPLLFSPQKKLSTNYFTDSSASVKEDIKLVFEVFLRKKKKNTVIVGDCVSITEGLVGELMGRVERGEVPAELKQIQFVKFQFAPVSLRFMKKEDVEMNITQLKRKVDSIGDSGVIIYTGDLKWTVEESAINGEYSPVDHLVAETGRLLSDYSCSNARVWLMATANYQTYMRCQMRQPSLEIEWALQAVSVPSGGLGLSLHGSSIHESRMTFNQNPSQVLETKPLISNSKDEQDKLTCCPECISSYEKEAQVLKSVQQKNLPPWLNPRGTTTNDMNEEAELRRKWNGLCQGLHHQGRNTQNNLASTFCNNNNQGLTGKSYSLYPRWPSQNNIFQDSNSISFTDSALKPDFTSSFVPKFRRQQSCKIDFKFGDVTQKQQPNLDSLKNTQGKEVKITLALGNSFFSATGESAKGKNDLCRLLQDNVPWQSEIIHSIAEALFESKSNRKGTWLLIQGNDIVGKRILALTIAESVLGSADSLLYINMKRRDNEAVPYSEMITRAFRSQERLVALVEDIDFSDTHLLKFLADGFESGKFGESGNLGQAIFILTRGSDFMGYEHGKTNQNSVIRMTLEVKQTKLDSFGTPNTDRKRKAERDISGRRKAPRSEEKEDAENGSSKKDCFSRQTSFNTLDLNIKANEEDDEHGEEKHVEFSPISSDLTREAASDPVAPSRFLDLIKNRFVLNRNDGQGRKIMREEFSTKMNKCVEEAFGDQNSIGFSIEERVSEEIVDKFGYIVNSVIERWLKDIFQTTLHTIKIGGKEGTVIRLCFEGTNDKVLGDGFMGTCLPKKIQVSFMD